MRNKLIAFLLVASLVVAFAPVAASASAQSGRTRVIALGTAIDHGRFVQGFAFVHGRPAPGRPSRPPKVDPLYNFIAKGAKWRSVEPYVVNPANGDSASSALITGALADGIATWEAQAGVDVLGTGSATNDALQSDWVKPDDVNEVYFSSTELDSKTVAITIVWGVFSGPLDKREITEWDMVFNDALPEAWGDATADDGYWDVPNIATHELGHAAGLGDLYSTAGTEQTMYGYASPGEIKKRTLESGDIAGIKALYR